MKKIIAIALVAALSLLVLVGCGSDATGEIQWVAECYERSYPHKIVVESSQQFGNRTLYNETEIVRSSIGGDFVAMMTVKGQQMRTIEAGSGTVVMGPVEDLDNEIWFRNGTGTSTDKVTWDEAGENFFPSQGSFALNLNPDILKDVTYKGDDMSGTLSFVVEKNNTAAFFGEDGKVEADVNVTIRTGGGNVIGVEIVWSIPANTATGVETMTVRIVTEYIYTQQKLSLD